MDAATTIGQVRNECIEVADGVELSADLWDPDGIPTGPAFLLVHGLASNARMWDGVAVRLAAMGHPVVTVDLRGHGRSSKPDGPYDVPTVAEDLASLIDRMAMDQPIVAGQSWGGNVAVELASRYPAATRGIVGIDGGWIDLAREFPEWERCRSALAPPRLAGRRLDEVEGYIRSAHADWPESGILGALANFEVRPDGTIAPWLSFEHHMLVLRGLWEQDPVARYPSVAVPALLIPADGGDDRTDQRHRAVDLAASTIPDARVRPIAGDHDIHAQHPDEVSSVLHESVTDGFFA